MKIRLVTTELFHADGRIDRHDEENSNFRSFANAHGKEEDIGGPSITYGGEGGRRMNTKL
jgi:hypothetical protein